MDREELERIKEEISQIENEKERRKLEKQIAKVEKKLRLNNFLTGVNDILGDNPKEKKFKYSDEELDNLGLEDWQKKEVKKGNYDVSGFEEEDELEDDDYYSEDV